MDLLIELVSWLLGDADSADETPAASAAVARDPAAGLRETAERLGLARLDYRPA